MNQEIDHSIKQFSHIEYTPSVTITDEVNYHRCYEKWNIKKIIINCVYFYLFWGSFLRMTLKIINRATNKY